MLPPPPSAAEQQQQHAAPYLHERTPSQIERPDYDEIVARDKALGQPRLIRSDTAFAHATEVRFDDLTYTVQKPTERASGITVGAQCLRFWSLPFACLLNRQPADQPVSLKVSPSVCPSVRI